MINDVGCFLPAVLGVLHQEVSKFSDKALVLLAFETLFLRVNVQ